MRSADLETLRLLKERVTRCLRAGADAAGCTVDIEWADCTYANMIDNQALTSSYTANLSAWAGLCRITEKPVWWGVRIWEM